MKDETADTLIELLTRIVLQNEEVLRQNGKFLSFLRERDADAAALTALRLAEERKCAEERAEDRKLSNEARQAIGLSAHDVALLSWLERIGMYRIADAFKTRVEARAEQVLSTSATPVEETFGRAPHERRPDSALPGRSPLHPVARV